MIHSATPLAVVRMRRLLFVTLLLFAVGVRPTHAQTSMASPPSAADAETRSQAQRYFMAGVSLQKTEDFEAAISAYQTSIRLYPTKSALFNLANCQRAQHLYAEAWSTLSTLQAQFGTELVEPMSSTSRAQMEELENLTAQLTVISQPTGANVEIDGKPQAATPWIAPVRLTIGAHVVRVSHPGYAPRTNTITLSPRQVLTLAFPLLEAAAGPTSVAPASERTASTPTDSMVRPVIGWLGVLGGVTSLAIATNVGLRALELDEDLQAACDAGHCSAGGAPRVERLERLTTTANVWWGAGGVLLATGATLLLWPVFTEPETSMSVGVGPSGVRFRGAF
jgi:PEGA domain